MEWVADLLLGAGGVLLYWRQRRIEQRCRSNRERTDRLYKRARNAISRHVRSRLH